jgi:AcrR family transcriptional regulator
VPDASTTRKRQPTLQTGRRTRLSPAARESAILDVARAIFETEPYDAVTLEQVAERAGVSPALVHHYFGSKRGLFHALVKQAIEGFLVALASPPGEPSAGSPRDAIDGALDRYLAFIRERPNGYAFVIGARGAPDARITKMIADGREVAYRAVLALLGIAEPTPAQGLRVWSWIGAVEAASTRWLREETVTAQELKGVLLGLLPDATAR